MGRNPGFYLTEEERDQIKKACRDAGYDTQTQITDALAQTKAYSDRKISQTMISHVLGTGIRSIPENMRKGLQEITGNDPRLSFLNDKNRLSRYGGRDSVLTDYLQKVASVYESSEAAAKLRILGRLERIVQNFSE